MGFARQTVRLYIDGDDKVQAHKQEVGHVLPGKPSRLKVGVDEAQPPEVSRAEPEKPKVRDEYAAAFPDKDMGNVSTTVQQEAQLPPDLPGHLRQAACRFGGHDLFCAGLAASETLDLLDLGCFDTCGFSFDLGYGFPPA